MKRKLRILKNNQIVDDAVIRSTENTAIQLRAANDLFVVDRIGSKSARRRLSAEPAASKTDLSSVISKTEQVLVRRAAEKCSRRVPPVKKTALQLTDLWAEPVIATRRAPEVRKSVRLAGAGHSYNPSVEAHLKLVAEAVSVEEAREKQQAMYEDKTSLLFSDSLLLTGVDDDKNDDDSDEENEEASTDANDTKKPLRLKGKLTKTQRNKRRARKILELEAHRKQMEKKISHSLNSLRSVVKQLNVEEANRIANKSKLPSSEKDSDKLRYEDIPCVPLLDELNGSLRQVIPKGWATRDRALEMRRSGRLMDPNRRSRKQYEKPHAAPNITWHSREKL